MIPTTLMATPAPNGTTWAVSCHVGDVIINGYWYPDGRVGNVALYVFDKYGQPGRIVAKFPLEVAA